MALLREKDRIYRTPQDICTHLGEDYEDYYGAVNPPIYQTTLFTGQSASQHGYIYTRVANPTTEVAERKIAALEGADGALCFGAGMGAINGIVIAKLGVPPFIATLGMMVIVYGANAIYFDSEPNNSQPIGGLRSDFTTLGTGAVGDGDWSVPYLVIIAATTAVLFWFLLNKTVFGKQVYALGGNPHAAQVSGVAIARNLVIIYALAGAAYGLGGVLEAARTGGANSTYGTLYELDAIAACVVGGVSTVGGVGRVGGIVAGVLVFGVINYGLTFIGVNPFWQQIIKGAIIISAVAFDLYRSRKHGLVRV